jgi:hypothetical protein
MNADFVYIGLIRVNLPESAGKCRGMMLNVADKGNLVCRGCLPDPVLGRMMPHSYRGLLDLRSLELHIFTLVRKPQVFPTNE